MRKCERVTSISGPGPQLGAIPRYNNVKGKVFLDLKKYICKNFGAQFFYCLIYYLKYT